MNNHESCMSPSTGLVCFLAGSLAGAGFALLLAPQSGRVARERMQRALGTTADSARDLKEQLLRRGEKIRNEARHRVDGAVSALAGDAKLPV